MKTTQLEIYKNDEGNIVLNQNSFSEDSFVVITPEMIGLVIQGLTDLRESTETLTTNTEETI